MNKIQIKIYLIIIILIGLLPFTWFKSGCIINGTDLGFPMVNPSKVFLQYLYTWNDHFSLGTPFARGIAQLPYQLFLVSLDKIGFSVQSTEKIFFSLILMLAGISMFYLMRSIFINVSPMVAFISSLFYQLNFFTMTVTWRMITLTLLVYAFLPLVFACYLQFLKNYKMRYFWGFHIAFVFINSCSNPIFYLFTWFIILLHGIFMYYYKEYTFRKLSVNILILLISNIILNSWWILPMISDISAEYTQAISSYIEGGPLEVLNITTSASHISELLQLRGYWPFYSIFQGDPYYNYQSIYFSTFFMLIGSLIPIFVFSSLLWPQKEKKNRNIIIFFVIIVLISIFIIKGTKPPFGNILYKFLFSMPFMGILRNPIDKIGYFLLLGYSILFSIGIYGCYEFIKVKSRKIANYSLVILCIIFFIIYCFPFWTGEIIYDGGNIVPGYHTKVPNYYSNADKWLQSSNKENLRIFPYPYLEQYFGAAYDWEYGYIGVNAPEALLASPVISRTALLLPQFIFKGLENRKDYAVALMGMLSSKYLLFTRDFSWKYYHHYLQYNADYYRGCLLNRKDISIDKTFGKLEFYRIPDKYCLPYIYASQTPSIVNIDYNKEQVKFSGINNINKVDFKKINPTKYIVYIDNKEPLYLIFNQLFNVNWKLQTKQNEVFEHYIANNYANGYKINKIGKYEIILEYTNQKLFYAGIIISFLFLIIFITIQVKQNAKKNI